MRISDFKSAMLTALSAALISGYYSQSYSDLEAMDVNCPSRDKCLGYRNNLTYVDRSCECDFNCTAYKDCCVDALPSQTTQASRPRARTDVKCLHYGEDLHTGVYVVSKCSNNWNGPTEIREQCLGRGNFSDPLVAAPVTDVNRKETYRNLACAQCNNVNLATLTTFQMKLSCEGLRGLTEQQIMAELTYNQQFDLWGVYRLNGDAMEFVGCDIIYDVPGYINNSVRFCRSNVVSTCPANWTTRAAVRTMCAQYMTVVYSNTEAYRNPHCAICNNKTVSQISCQTNISKRKRPMSFALILDINPTDGEEVGMRPVATPQCSSNHKYDPYFKKCRRLLCALPGHDIVNGRCVKV